MRRAVVIKMVGDAAIGNAIEDAVRGYTSA